MERCDICPNNCLYGNSICGRGIGLDENIVETTAIAIDPVEKKPLYHYKPGSETLSVGTLGCNLKCLNCQNHSIAQPINRNLVPIRSFTPTEIVEIALEHNLDSISWTYNEPSIHPEWIINTSRIAQEYDISTILVTNGYTSKKTLKELGNCVDAVNVDLKSVDEVFYENVCSGNLDVVKNSIEFYYKNNIHTEVTTLVIPTFNDSVESISGVCEFISSLSGDIVLHFSAFYPHFKLNNLPSTTDECIIEACKIGKEYGINYVYPGNIRPSSYDNTYCKNCNALLINRKYYDSVSYIDSDKCPSCGLANNIVF